MFNIHLGRKHATDGSQLQSSILANHIQLVLHNDNFFCIKANFCHFNLGSTENGKYYVISVRKLS